MPASPQYSFVVEGGNSTGSATHLFLISSSSGSSIRIEVKPSQSHWRPWPLMNPSIVLATSSRVRFIIYPESKMSPESFRCKPAFECLSVHPEEFRSRFVWFRHPVIEYGSSEENLGYA